MRPSDVAAWPAPQWTAFLDALTAHGVTATEQDARDFAVEYLRNPTTARPPNLRDTWRTRSQAERQLLAAWFWPNPYLIPVTEAEFMDFASPGGTFSARALGTSRRVNESLKRLFYGAAALTPGGSPGEVTHLLSLIDRGNPLSAPHLPPTPFTGGTPVTRRRVHTLMSDETCHVDIETLFAISHLLGLSVEDDRWFFQNGPLVEMTFEHLHLRDRVTTATRAMGFTQLRELLTQAETLGALDQPSWADAAQPAKFHAALPSPPTASKYLPLFNELDALKASDPGKTFTLAELHDLVSRHEPQTGTRGRPGGPGLPASAFTGNAWWANTPEKAQARAWLAAGFESTSPRRVGPPSRPDLRRTTVTFRPRQGRELWWPHREQLRRDPNASPDMRTAPR